MPDIKKRFVVGILGMALAVALAGCASDDGPGTTTPGGSDTTEPVGS